MANKFSINFPALTILLIILCIGCVSKKKIGAHFHAPAKVKQTEFHKLKPEHRVIIKGFQDYQALDTVKVEKRDSLVKTMKEEGAFLDSVKIPNNDKGRFFISRAHDIIPPNDPRLEKLPKPKKRKESKQGRKKRRHTEEPFGPLSLMLLPLVIFAARFSLIAGGVFFIVGGILSIMGFLRVRDHSHRLKGIGWTHASMTLYGLILGGLMVFGLLRLFGAWLFYVGG